MSDRSVTCMAPNERREDIIMVNANELDSICGITDASYTETADRSRPINEVARHYPAHLPDV